MWFKQYLFSIEGRFARVHWWGALLFWSFAFVWLSQLLGPILPVQVQDCATTQTPGSMTTLCLPSWRVVIPMLAFLSLVSIPPMIKRLHDRGKAGHWAFIYLALAFAPMAIVSLIGPSTFLISEFLWKVVIGLNVFSLLATLIIGIEFGFMRGTKGPNSYGPEPTHFSTLRKM